jgi:non-heme chloroperoxidase
MPPQSHIKTWDGVTLSYTQSGPVDSANLLFISGWAQTAEEWHKQFTHFSKNYRVTTYDHRGQGESEKTSRGYRISRLAADLNDLITQLDLKDITIVAHSMGCSVTWCYWDLFADSRKRISKLVFVDQPAYLTANPAWTPEYATQLSAVFTSEAVYGLANGISGPDGSSTTTGLLKQLFSESVTQEDFEWVLKQNLKMEGKSSAMLLLDHASNDWRDVLPMINVPTLVVGAKGSIFGPHGLEWIAGQIKGSKCEIFENEDGGSHFMFWENAQHFNSVLEDFIKG